MPNSYDIIITTDRTMMSNHHGKEFLGFMTTGPPIGFPEKIWLWLSAPKPKIDSEGIPLEAPYGLRKVEATLIDHGYNASVIDPDYIEKYVEKTRIIMIGHHDYFAYGPPSNEWWMLTGKEPINRTSFIRLMNSRGIRKAVARNKKIIVGGPAAWQWLYELEAWKKWGITTVIDGEAEKIIVDVVERILRNEEVPDYIYVGVKDVPSIREIPLIKRPSVNGLVEIMRGCPRGCRFCSVTLRPLRFIPLEKIEKEVLVNVDNGVKRSLLHSEDVLLYYADGIKPRPEPLLKLHETVLKHVDNIAWSHASLAAIKYAEEEYGLISKIMELVSRKQDYLGVEVGIETGSIRLAKKIMPAKTLPYDPEEWSEVVEDAFRIMHENKIIPAATLILGLPNETTDDIIKTIELIDRLKNYRSIIVPMFFVPMGMLRHKNMFLRNMLKEEHIILMKKLLEHSLYWADDIVKKFYLKEPYQAPLRAGLKMLLEFIKIKTRKYLSEETLLLKA